MWSPENPGKNEEQSRESLSSTDSHYCLLAPMGTSSPFGRKARKGGIIGDSDSSQSDFVRKKCIPHAKVITCRISFLEELGFLDELPMLNAASRGAVTKLSITWHSKLDMNYV